MKYEIGKRSERRIKKEIPFVFIYKKQNLDANTVNYSKNGLGIKIYRKVALPVGDVLNIQARDSNVKAQVMWVKKEIDPLITMIGLKLVEGTLNLKGTRRNTHLIMMR
ncbi:MAG: PilZ domain-containing protein [Cyclobacteriaceae bacterium]|nr:PilZ domain-containing protein [Cyclobacteriaceae bacterium]